MTPKQIAESLTDAQRLTLAKAIASAMGDNFTDAFKNKERWVAKRGQSGGRYRDINEPFQSDYLDAADAAFGAVRAVLMEEPKP